MKPKPAWENDLILWRNRLTACVFCPSDDIAAGRLLLHRCPVAAESQLASIVLLTILPQEGVECIVAPFEADSQLAYMVREGHAHAAGEFSKFGELILMLSSTVFGKMFKVQYDNQVWLHIQCALIRPMRSGKF